MNTSNARFAVALLIAAGLFAGCAATPTTDDNSSDVVVDEPAAAPLAGASEVRVERRAGEESFELVNAPGFRALTDGVWEYGEGESAQRVVVGEAGHAWLAEQTTRQIEALRSQVDGSDHAGSALQQIDRLEQVREQAQAALVSERARSKSPVSSLTTSCNLSFYTGPSGAVTSPPVTGAAALAQIVCSGGCVAFTVTSQACCGGLCTPVAAQTNTVCSSPWLAGSIRSGFGSGSALMNINPPNSTQSNSSFVCN